MKRLLTVSLITLLFASCSTSVATDRSDSVHETSRNRSSFIRDSICTIDSLELTFFIPIECTLEITNTRPGKNDSDVVMCCAAAFTRLENDAIDGLYIIRGKVIVPKVNRGLGGGITIHSTGNILDCKIAGTEMGSKLDSTFIEKATRDSVYFFQQIQLVRDGLPLVFRKDLSLFQRRAVCILNGRAVIVESGTACTLQKFADVLDAAGIDNALYLDMGSWDEGWFRSKNGVINTIGLLRTATRRQSNWIVYRSKN